MRWRTCSTLRSAASAKCWSGLHRRSSSSSCQSCRSTVHSLAINALKLHLWFPCRNSNANLGLGNASWLSAGYIGEFEMVDDHRSGKIVVELNGRLNKCGVISPRYNVGVGELEAWTARLLPSRQVLILPMPLFFSQSISESISLALKTKLVVLSPRW